MKIKRTAGLHDSGTAGLLMGLNTSSGLPTRNFQEGVFDGAAKIAGDAINENILVGRGGCYSCVVRCKPEVASGKPYNVNSVYGGPEYETLASLGSDCSIDNLEAIAKGNELCAAYGLDSISTGAGIAFAMECFERGILTEKDTGGLKLKFGDAEAMLQMVEKIAQREGFGELLGEGVARAASAIGKGAEEFAMHIKGQELPMHEPRFKPGMGVGYTISPTGADHMHNIHDVAYTAPNIAMNEINELGIHGFLPCQELSPPKVRLLVYGSTWRHTLNCLVFCVFVVLTPNQINDLVRAVTGWNTTVWELMKVGERCVNMTRAFNFREGKNRKDDYLPRRFFTPFASGPLKGTAVDDKQLEQSIDLYHDMVGWDRKTGAPTLTKLQELGIEWLASV
jgi:aldehyde:ferredoxin oxidoreductase